MDFCVYQNKLAYHVSDFESEQATSFAIHLHIIFSHSTTNRHSLYAYIHIPLDEYKNFLYVKIALYLYNKKGMRKYLKI